MKLLTLVALTLRELVAKATIIVLAAISTLVMLGVLAAVSATETAEGVQLMVFGNAAGPPAPPETLMRLVGGIQASLFGGLSFGVMLFGVIATAGVVPDTLEKGMVDIYLSKPLARWELLFGRYLGAVAVILANVAYFLLGIWVIIGLRVGTWNHALLIAVAGLPLVFAALFSMVTLVGVLSRNTAIAIIAAFLYLVVIGPVLNGREASLYLLSESAVYRGILDGLYYLFPQLNAMQDQISGAIMQKEIAWAPFVQSFLSSSAIFAGGVFLLNKKDF